MAGLLATTVPRGRSELEWLKEMCLVSSCLIGFPFLASSSGENHFLFFQYLQILVEEVDVCDIVWLTQQNNPALRRGRMAGGRGLAFILVHRVRYVGASLGMRAERRIGSSL